MIKKNPLRRLRGGGVSKIGSNERLEKKLKIDFRRSRENCRKERRLEAW